MRALQIKDRDFVFYFDIEYHDILPTKYSTKKLWYFFYRAGLELASFQAGVTALTNWATHRVFELHEILYMLRIDLCQYKNDSAFLLLFLYAVERNVSFEDNDITSLQYKNVHI